ncbi:MAG TPA: pantetheine-phosphate adenylyltransferase [bacterium]|nr:pantetheine-phosphate adenylyltransferase [bacterium]
MDKAAEKIAVYPGSFDPVTYGHIDVIEKGFSFLDKIVIAVSTYPRKSFLFDVEERMGLLKEIYGNNSKVEIDMFDGLLVNYLQKKNINIILRGLRAVSDFEYEFQMALTNRILDKRIETVFLMPGEEFFFISSSLVKEIAFLKGDISKFVPESVKKALIEKLAGNK